MDLINFPIRPSNLSNIWDFFSSQIFEIMIEMTLKWPHIYWPGMFIYIHTEMLTFFIVR